MQTGQTEIWIVDIDRYSLIIHGITILKNAYLIKCKKVQDTVLTNISHGAVIFVSPDNPDESRDVKKKSEH